MSIQKSLKNAMLTGNGLVSWSNNEPSQYAGRQHQYFSAETRTFTQSKAKYASDYIEAQVQGLDPANPSGWQTRLLRMADIVKPTAAIQRNFDDYKMVLFADRDIEYLMPGSKIVTMGNTWLAVNPLNVSGSDGASVVRRCNAVWNFYDYYGNIVSEPMVVENTRANANDNDTQQTIQIAKGYFNAICQYNDNTRQIDTNTRMILGTGAYRVTGYSDFETEFTGDYSSVRTLSFSLRYEEANHTIDDMENHIAGGKTFSWIVSVSGANLMTINATTQLVPTSVRNGKEVISTEEYPITYEWQSSDESVLTVDGTGLVTAVGAGSAYVVVKLVQNPDIQSVCQIDVTETEDAVLFFTAPPMEMSAYQTVTIAAAFFEDGEETEDALVWALDGADRNAYSYTIKESGKEIELKCFGYSKEPLHIKATHGLYFAMASVNLTGF